MCKSCTKELNESENKIPLEDESFQENSQKSNNRKTRNQKNIQPVNINFRKNSISKIQVPLNLIKSKQKLKSTTISPSKQININILKPKRKSTTSSSKQPNINILKPKRKASNTSPLKETKINILKPKRKSTTTSNSSKEIHINILQPKRKSNTTPPSSVSAPKTVIKRIFIKVPPRKVRIIEGNKYI